MDDRFPDLVGIYPQEETLAKKEQLVAALPLMRSKNGHNATAAATNVGTAGASVSTAKAVVVAAETEDQPIVLLSAWQAKVAQEEMLDADCQHIPTAARRVLISKIQIKLMGSMLTCRVGSNLELVKRTATKEKAPK